MSVEFVDTNILIYAHDGGAGGKHDKSVALLTRLVEEATGALSVQVLTEFYSAATRKLGMKSQEAEEVIADLRAWTIHRPGHADVLRSAQLQRRYKIAWWDALVVNSALELGCSVLWSERLAGRRRYGSLTVRNPFT
ncbi:MAG: PIN domain-containing protein [Bryobacteraceae bacterium]|jgi:predicted nucleic acid-binding protein